MQAFVSYSSHDTPFVHGEILPAMASVGVTAWVYQATVPGGNWIEAVFQQIRDGDWLIVVLTEMYATSVQDKQGACYHELLWMLDQVTTSRRRTRLVVLWKNGTMPELLRAWQAIDLRDNMASLVPSLTRTVEADRQLSAETAKRTQQATQFTCEERPCPPVSGPADLPDLARFNFDLIAPKYHRAMVAGKPMQRDNAEVLLHIVSRLIRQGKARRPEAWLDAGCGTGLMASLCDERKWSNGFDWLRNVRTRVGFDYSTRMLAVAKNVAATDSTEGYTDVLEGDCRWFGSDTLTSGAGIPRVDLIFMNNVLHWLFSDDAIERALRQSYEMLDRGGGCLAASIAGVGTASEFYKAYRAELEERLDKHEREKWQIHIGNPIGLQSLDTVVEIARRCRFRIEDAELRYEPKDYHSTDDYVRDVRAYGEEVLMAPLLRLPRPEREKVWTCVADRFRELHRAKFNQPNYVHNQFVIYLAAVRHD